MSKDIVKIVKQQETFFPGILAKEHGLEEGDKLTIQRQNSKGPELKTEMVCRITKEGAISINTNPDNN